MPRDRPSPGFKLSVSLFGGGHSVPPPYAGSPPAPPPCRGSTCSNTALLRHYFDPEVVRAARLLVPLLVELCARGVRGKKNTNLHGFAAYNAPESNSGGAPARVECSSPRASSSWSLCWANLSAAGSVFPSARGEKRVRLSLVHPLSHAKFDGH